MPILGREDTINDMECNKTKKERMINCPHIMEMSPSFVPPLPAMTSHFFPFSAR